MSVNIRPLSESLSLKAKNELNEVPERIPEDLKQIREWLSKQPHLKVRDDDQFLVNFLRSSKYSLERTKEKLDLYYSVRTSIPELFLNRDPLSKMNLEIIRMGTMIPLPITDDGPRIVIMRPTLYDPKKFTMEEVFSVNTFTIEILMYEDDNAIVAGQIGIIDLSGASMGHLAQLSPSFMKKTTMLGQEASPLRMKGLHYLHTPPGFETVFNFSKGLLNEKNRSRLYVHGSNFESLYQQIPRKLLPTEYGGDAGPFQDIIDHWEKKIIAYRDFLLEESNYGADESKSIGRRSNQLESVFGTDGSFRKLNVD